MSEPFNDSPEATGWSDWLAGLDRQSRIVLIALSGVILLLAGLLLGAVFGGDSTDRVVGAAATSSLGTESTAPAPTSSPSTVSTAAETTASSTTSSSTTTAPPTTTTAATTTTTAPPTTTTAATTTTTTLLLVIESGEIIEAGHAIDLDTGMTYTFPTNPDLVDPVLWAAVDFTLDEVLLAGSGYNVVVSPMNGAVVTNQDVPDDSCNAGTGVFGTTKVFVNFDDIGGSTPFDGYYCFITTEGNFGLAVPIQVTGAQDPVGFFFVTVEPPGIP